jgi:nucleoside-triphosphatase THEP1
MSLYEEHLEAIKKSAIGNTVEEISEEAKRTGWSIRVLKQDGKDCMGACDYNPGRINVAVDNGKITEIIGLG